MRKLWLALSLLCLGQAPAQAQTFSMPPPAGVAVIGCVYNSTPPTLVSGTPGYVQCDTNGAFRLGTAPAGTIIGTVAIDQTTPGTTNGVQVNAPLPAGTNGIGNVGGKTVSSCVTPTVTTANAYGTNYVVGGKLTFASAFTAVGSGILQSVTVTINKVETNGFTFTPFHTNPTNSTWTDAAVAAINAADVPFQRGAVSLTASSVLGTTTVASAVGIGQAMAPGTTSLYGVLTSNAALTNNFTTTSDVQVCVTILQDL